jgi:hypothetical protein
MLGRNRRNVLKAVAYRVALRLHEVSKPFIDRGEETPPMLLEHEFRTVCDQFDGRPLTTGEIELLAIKLVPKAIDQITKRIQRAADEVGRVADSMEAAQMRIAA